jgi:GT2 family glycosyltransferase
VLRFSGEPDVYAAWLPKLSRRAVVVIVGINVREAPTFGVELWRELARAHPHFEFLHGGGLGVVAIGDVPDELRPLFGLTEDQRTTGLVRLAYERLGASLRDRGVVDNMRAERTARIRELEAEVGWAYDELIRGSAYARRMHAQLMLIESSTTWRLTSRPRAFLARHPKVRTIARATTAVVWRALTWPFRRGRRRAMVQNPDHGYQHWVELHDTLNRGERLAMAEFGRTTEAQPLISVVMPVCDPPPELLSAAIESVRDQVYEQWELCIADDASTSQAVRQVLEKAERDPRIKVVHRSRRGGISAASNDAVAVANGIYVALLDHDDVLRPHALLLVAEAVGAQPDAVLVYSDEDKLDERGKRCEHYFKPDWNPALLLSQNYIAHLTVIEAARLRDVGGFRSGFDGSQDWDLVLRVTDGMPAARICHIPHVLYHWRRTEGSTAQRLEAKPDAVGAGRRAVEDALARRGIRGTVTTVHEAYQSVRYAVPTPRPRVDVVIPSARFEFLEPCLDGLLRNTAYDPLTVTLVVSRGRLEAPKELRFLERAQQDPRVRLHVYEDRGFNYSWANNTAAAELDAPLLLLMNDDLLVIREDWLEVMVGHVLQEDVGAVGAKLYYPSEEVQHGGVILGGGGIAAHYHHALPREHPGYHGRAWLAQDLSCVTAAVMLLRREAFNAIGGFDEELAIAFNDVDLCLRLIDAGWRIVWTPDVELYHRESVSVGRHDSPERRDEFDSEERLMVRRWGERLLTDPHYNPNLSLLSLNTPSFPPRVEYPWRLDYASKSMGGRQLA